MGFRAPKVPIVISIQLPASTPFLIIHSTITEETVVFHGRGSADKLLPESCPAVRGGRFRARLQKEEFRAEMT